MSEHLTDEQIGAFLAASLDTRELLVVDKHFQECVDCRKHTAENSVTPEVLQALSEQFFETQIAHPPHEQLQLYLDDKLDPVDREILYSHVSLCSECSDEVLELRQIKTAMPEDKESRFHPQQKLKPFLKKLFPRLLGGVAAIAFVLYAGSFLLRDRPSDKPEAIHPVETGNQKTPEAPGGAVTASINDRSGTITVYENGFIAGLDSFPPKYRTIAEQALKAEELILTKWVNNLKERTLDSNGDAAGAIDSFALSDPVGVVVVSDSPLFQWKPLPAPALYTIELFQSNFDSVATSSPIRKNSWSYGGKLERGRTYLWRVTADRNGEKITSPQPPALPAKFYVLDQKRLQQLEEIRNMQPGSHLLLGIAYAEAGLTKDAEKEFGTLLKMNPDSQVTLKLLESVRSL